MKVKFKLSIWVIAVIVVVITGITALLLRQASAISLNLNLRSPEHLTNSVEFWNGREDGYIQSLHTLANVMGDYETIQAEERRDRYDELLKSALETEPQLVLLYTVWKPNAIDGMDELFIGRTGSSPTGQYAMTYSKETGTMVKRVSADIEGSMAYITGPNAHKDCIDNPILRKINGNDKYTIRMMVPITNNNNDEVVGALGCLLVIDVIQKILENTLETNNEIALMVIYSNDGTILAHFKSEQIGRNMPDDNIRFVVKPIKMGDSNFNLTALIGVPESYILKEIKAITRFSIIMAAIAILVTAAIIFIVLGFITKPIITVTDTLKDISEEQININVNGVNGISGKNRVNIEQLVLKVPLLKVA